MGLRVVGIGLRVDGMGLRVDGMGLRKQETQHFLKNFIQNLIFE